MGDDGEEMSPQPLVIDLSHLDSEIVEIAIEDLYAENASARLETRSKLLALARNLRPLTHSQDTQIPKIGSISPSPFYQLQTN